MIVAEREIEMVAERNVSVQPLLMSGVRAKTIWVHWYEQSETVVARVLEVTPDCKSLAAGDVILVPPYSVDVVELEGGDVLHLTHESNAIAKIRGAR